MKSDQWVRLPSGTIVHLEHVIEAQFLNIGDGEIFVTFDVPKDSVVGLVLRYYRGDDALALYRWLSHLATTIFPAEKE